MTARARQVSLLPSGVALRFEWKGLRIIASVDGQELHVSMSRPDRYPTWEEIKAVKALFWDDEADVIMFLPPASEYVNVHPNCFHLYGDPAGRRRWRLGSILEVFRPR
ncbi:MAG TPA: hypothetical protein VGK74_22320 [Symbiobacteriaceae bacterium]|jgi:hypothetical protein